MGFLPFKKKKKVKYFPTMKGDHGHSKREKVSRDLLLPCQLLSWEEVQLQKEGRRAEGKYPRNFYKLAGKGNSTPSCSILEGDGRQTRPGVCNQSKLLCASHWGGAASLLKRGVLRIRQHLLLTVQSQPSCVIKASPSVAKFPNFTSKDQILPC